MDVASHHSKLPSMTPAQQGVFFDLFKKQMPPWLLAASEVLRGELYESLKSSYKSRSTALEQLKAFQSPQSFCTPLLAKAMSEKLGEPFEVEGAIFQHIRSTSSLLGLRKKLVLPIDRDVLTAACENFELSETLADSYHEDSLLYVPARLTGRSSQMLSIKPHEFARLCRYLDLGKEYKKHVETLFGNDTQVASLQAASVACARDQFEVDRHIAYMREYIGADVYLMLQSVKDSQPSIKLGKNTLGYQNLQMLGVTLRGPMFIGPVSEAADEDYRCVIYIPQDPDHPLKEYSSFSAFELELSNRLRNAEFRSFFMRFISLEDRATFLTGLNWRLLNVKPSQFPYASLVVPLTGVDPEGDAKLDLFLAIFRHRAAQVRADSLLLVVPTDAEDAKTRLARLETYKSVGLNTVMFFASFVPVLGQVMFAVAGLQLLKEIYEGIDSWAHGDQEHATDCLFDTLENLILMAAFAAGGTAASKAFKTVRASGFVQGLRRVTVAPQSRRLWNPDMAAYRQPEAIPRHLPADSQGLVSRGDHRYVSLGSDAFAVNPLRGTGLWEVSSTPLSARYSPVLETNGEGAWRHDSELPQDWNTLTLFRRLGYREDQVPEARALQLIASTGINEDAMRQLLVQRGNPMAVLTDSVKRFGADAQVAAFLEQVASPSSVSLADADLQLYLLTAAGRWPRDMAIIVSAVGDGQVARYGSETASRRVKISDDALRQGKFYQPLLAALSNKERARLLGATTAEQTNQVELLASHIGSLAPRMRMALMDRLYRRADVTQQPLSEPIRSAFADLSASVADELVQHANVREWEQLADGNVPLRVAEEARRYQQIQRLNRSYEGLYLDAASGYDADLLVLDTLVHLPGWPGDVRMEILDWGVYADQRATVGPEDAPFKVVIEAYSERYQGRNKQETIVSTQPTRTRAHFFQALWESLPELSRKAIDVDGDADGTGLRQKITALALHRREAFAKVLGIEPVHADYRSPMGLADRRVEQAWVQTLADSDPVVPRSAAIRRRARELYPAHSTEQIERFVASLDADDVLAIRKLEQMREQYQTLVDTLERWTQRDTWYHEADGSRLKVPRHSKHRAAQLILRAWRKETRSGLFEGQLSYDLSFDALPLGDLPVLIGDFSHVATLRLSGVGASAGLNSFLRNFTHLRMLDLSGNRLTRIPQAIEDMSGLVRLDLSSNQIQLTDRAVLAPGTTDFLRSLDLSLNPTLARTPGFAAMRSLRHLNLRETGISEWPTDIDGLTHLETLDLRDNKIVDVPRAVFNARAVLNRGTNIDGNPLSAASLKAIIEYQQVHGISLGVVPAEYVDVLRPAADRTGAGWVRGLSDVPVARAQEVLSSLAADPDSGDFFDVFQRLRDTADFSRTRAQLGQRVWDVLEAACADDRLRRALFRMARVGRVSTVNVAGLFSDLEVRVLCYRASAAARTGTQTLEGELIGLLRGLFRLKEVERQALIEVARRAQTESLSFRQALDISLIYRVRLAERLQLPAQPRELNVLLDAEVSDEQLDHAYREVVETEQTSQLAESIGGQEFWAEYLLRTHQNAFAEIIDRSSRALTRLDAETHLSREAASQQMVSILDNFRNDNLQLCIRLTTEALARHPGLTVPAAVAPDALEA
ncbi:NEL-type E3 ubiquitin ligase domain-containing protein [Pseudomonas sp. A34-9]|uniref:NEL-type E3 ubiquitin ligase domain-containing protein n=1 Tax=Pseudomonas sp. A34-9 TaxID=3034675 RepID=UPI00240E0BB1|nr:NEL-type E3 ubiquitin ligase domain-containing protein [Pseudomonas sp. A34-9]